MDYGGGWSTTSYGAQGGAGGGGFMSGSQGGSQENPAGKGTYGQDTLRPVTIKQVLEAQQPHPDATFKIDDVEVTQLSFVGQIRNISTQTTNITYKLDDGTGTVEVKQWIDADGTNDMSSSSPSKLSVNEWVRVWGRLKQFNDRRHVGAHVIRPVENKMEITYHLLEATYVHLYFTRGDPSQFSNDGGGQQDNGGGGYAGAGAGAGDNMSMNGRVMPNVSVNARKVYAALKNTPQGNEGLHVHNVAAILGLGVNEVMKGGDELLTHGLIYTTMDDSTWAIFEY